MEEAARRRPEARQYDAIVVYHDTVNDFRLYDSIESHLQQPLLLWNQDLFALPPALREVMVARYYAYNMDVMSEIASKQLTKSQRRDMDEIASRYNIAVPACRRQVHVACALDACTPRHLHAHRPPSSLSPLSLTPGLPPGLQFDNLRRILKAVESHDAGDIADFIVVHFRLPLPLAQ